MSFKRMFQAVETRSGELMRVITGGVPHIPGKTVYEQMQWLKENDDQIRLLTLREPRGYPPLGCNLIVPPKHPEADAGFINMEQTEYPVMTGGKTISCRHSVARNGHAAHERTRHGVRTRIACRIDLHKGGLRERKSDAGDVQECSRIRCSP